MKNLKYPLFFLALTSLFLSCSSIPAARNEYWEARNAALRNLQNREWVWEQKKEQFKKDVAKWNENIATVKKIKLEFIKTLSDDQLELYSLYNENVGKGESNIAKTELSFRRFNSVLNDMQKISFNGIIGYDKFLEEKGSSLYKKMDELNKEKKEIIADAQRYENIHREYLRLEGKIYSQNTDYYKNIQQSFYQWQEYQQRDATIRALNNISWVIRGY